MNQNSKKKILIIIIVVLVVIILAAGGYLLVRHLGLLSTGNTYKEAQESFANFTTEKAPVTDAEGSFINTTGATNPVPPSVDNPVNFKELQAQNPDIYAWIHMPDTNVNYPVLQSDQDDNLYLDHDLYKDYSFPGAIYSQSKNNKEFTDRVTVLYGHNMLDGSMFATLHNYEDETFFNSHPDFYVYTPTRKLTYRVVSAYDYDDRHILNSFDFSKNEVFSDWLTAAQSPHSIYSNVRTDVKLDLNSKMLVLSTCQNGGDGRYLVQGVLIKDEQTK